MLDKNSRYYETGTLTHTTVGRDGRKREITYLKRRFLPEPRELMPLVDHTVAANDRLDNVTARYLGEPTLFWRICDANNVFAPEELTDEPGRTICIAMPRIGKI